jgi:hypothetical protein
MTRGCAPRTPAARRGIALPVALILLGVGGVLAVGTTAAMRDAVRGSRAGAATLQARARAAAAVSWSVAHWRPAWAIALPPGSVHRQAVTTPAGDAALSVLRLDLHRYLVVGEASADTRVSGAGSRAIARTGAFVRLTRVLIEPPGALVAGGPIEAALGASLRGGDATPDDWTDCPPPQAGVSDVAVAVPADTIGLPPTVLGGAGVALTPAARDDALHEIFGDVTWTALTRRAGVALAAGTVASPSPRAGGSGCVVDADSWGEPRRGAGAVKDCIATAAVVHVRGSGVTRLRGPARFQGMLLVDGDLEVEGDVGVVGVVLVRGALRAPAAALRVTGALLVRQRAGAVAGVPAVVLGPLGVIRHSRCAITTVTLAASQPVLLGRRAWADVTP